MQAKRSRNAWVITLENPQNSDSPFRFLLEHFLSAHVITAPSMFTNLCLVLLLLFADSPVPKFFFQLKRKKTWEKSRKRSDIVQFGRCRDNFSSSVCSALSQSMLFQPMIASIISELCYKWLSSAQKVGSPRGIWFLSTPGLLSCNGTFAVFFLCSTHHSSPLFLHLHDSSFYNSEAIDFVSYYLLYSTFVFV